MAFEFELERLPKSVVLLAAAALTAGLGALDYLTSPEIHFSFFYLLPIALVTWYAGRRAGLAFCALGALTSLAANLRWRSLYVHSVFFEWNRVLSLALFVAAVLLLGELKRTLQLARALAQRDALTGVATRQAFCQSAEWEKNRARRHPAALTLACLDLDNFREINRRFGREAGDLLLRTVAQALLNNVRQTDTLGRTGGDKFAVLLPATGPEAAQVVAEKIRESLLELLEEGGWPVTFSMGVVTFLAAPDSLETMMQQADDVMAAVKSSGKNAIAQRVE